MPLSVLAAAEKAKTVLVRSMVDRRQYLFCKNLSPLDSEESNMYKNVQLIQLRGVEEPAYTTEGKLEYSCFHRAAKSAVIILNGI